MNKSALTILGTFIAIIGVLVFLQRAYFAEVVLGASSPPEHVALQLGGSLGDPKSEQQLKNDNAKQLAISLFGGMAFVLGFLVAFSGASRRDGGPTRFQGREFKASRETWGKTQAQAAEDFFRAPDISERHGK